MRALGWLMSLFSRLRHTPPPPPPTIDPVALREEMKRTDPDYAHVSRVQHDALQIVAAGPIADGIAIRRERKFWEAHGRTQDGPTK